MLGRSMRYQATTGGVRRHDGFRTVGHNGRQVWKKNCKLIFLSVASVKIFHH